jgi:hypothetical protein
MSDLFDPSAGAGPELAQTSRFIPEEVRRRLVIVVRDSPGAGRGEATFAPQGFAVLHMRSFDGPRTAAPEGSAPCIIEIPARDDSPVEPAAEALWGTR